MVHFFDRRHRLNPDEMDDGANRSTGGTDSTNV